MEKKYIEKDINLENLADQQHVDELFAEIKRINHRIEYSKDELGLTRSNRKTIKIVIFVAWILLGQYFFSLVTVVITAFLAFMYDTFLLVGKYPEEKALAQIIKDHTKASHEVIAQEQAKQKAKDYQLNYSSVLLEILIEQKEKGIW